MLTLGVVADTHVPVRARSLHPRVIPIFRKARVAAILHAGDICSLEVLKQLSEVAPTFAVQGNRDIWRLSHLPLKLTLEFGGIQIGLTHGHGGFTGYFSQKLSYLINGYQFRFYQKRLRREFPFAQVIVFGHTHRSENTWSDNVLIFNPGSTLRLKWGTVPPSIGLLNIPDEGEIRGEIIPLSV